MVRVMNSTRTGEINPEDYPGTLTFALGVYGDAQLSSLIRVFLLATYNSSSQTGTKLNRTTLTCTTVIIHSIQSRIVPVFPACLSVTLKFRFIYVPSVVPRVAFNQFSY